jgi:hypothetical protein
MATRHEAGDATTQVWWPRRGTQDGHAEALAQSITERRWSWNFVDRPSSLAEATWRAYPSDRVGTQPVAVVCTVCPRPPHGDLGGHGLLTGLDGDGHGLRHTHRAAHPQR